MSKPKLRGKTKYAAMLDDASYCGHKDGNIIELDEFGWDCCFVNGTGGVAINVNDKDTLIIDIYQLKVLFEHAQSVIDAMKDMEEERMGIKQCRCGKTTNTAVCDWINSKDNRADKCFAATDENGKWIKGCAFDKTPLYMKKSIDELLDLTEE